MMKRTPSKTAVTSTPMAIARRRNARVSSATVEGSPKPPSSARRRQGARTDAELRVCIGVHTRKRHASREADGGGLLAPAATLGRRYGVRGVNIPARGGSISVAVRDAVANGDG